MMAPAFEESGPAAAERRCSLLNFYWESEIQGLRLVFAMLKQLEDADSLTNLSRLAADGARHLWLLSKKIVELGGTPMPDSRAHRTRRAGMVRIPKDAAGLLALAVAVKERAYERYASDCPLADPAIAELRRTLGEDEKSHLAWLREKAAGVGGEAHSPGGIARYLMEEEAIYATFTTARSRS
jgi:rubrerythrin